MATKKKKATEKPKEAAGFPPIKGIAPKTYPALDKQCEKLVADRNAITKAREKEKETHAVLIDMMHERELTTYVHADSGKRFDIEAPEKVHFKNLEKKDKNGINPVDSDEEAEDDLDE